jgi:DNA-binding transcriptional LysR family regulator
MDDRLKGVATFVQTVEAGSFALAASRMGVTRSAVGKSIARLERRVGARLFNRTTRQQTLTENGQAFYERCKRALAEIDAAEEAFDAGRREPIGRLRVSTPVLLGRHCVVPVLSNLVKRYPRLEVEIDFNDRIVDLVQEGFDLAVRIGSLSDSTSLTARRIGLQHFAICASPSYLSTHGAPRKPADYADHTGIVYVRSGVETPWYMHDSSGERHELNIQRRLHFNDVQAIANAALAGVGLAVLPRWRIEAHLATGQLIVVADIEHLPATPIHVIWPKTRYLPSKTRVAIDSLVSEVPRLVHLPEGVKR